MNADPQRAAATQDDLIPAKRVAEQLGEHYQTTYRRLRTGQLRGVQYHKGGKWFVTRAALEQFLNPARTPARRGF